MTCRPETHRGPHRGRSRLVAAFALAAGVATASALSACSSGQITQTSTQVAAVPGANGNAGPGGSVALRNALIPYDGLQGFPKGGNAPIAVRIFNDGLTSITLVKVTADGTAANVAPVAGAKATKPVAVPTTAVPTTAVPKTSGSASPAVSGSAPASGAPKSAGPITPPVAAPAVTGISVAIAPSGYALLVPEETTYLQLTGLTKDLTPGMTVPVTFFFNDGSQVTLGLPVGPATAAVPRATSGVAPVAE